MSDMAIRILVSDPLEDAGLDILKKEKEFSIDVNTRLSPDDFKKVIKDYDALIVRSGSKVTADVIANAERLKVVGRAGVGLDNVDVEAASKRGIMVVNAPAGNTISTAEHTMSLMLSLARNVPQGNISMREGKWDRKSFTGVELYNKTLGIVGLGRIGAEVAKRALSFGMRILACDPFLSEQKAKQLAIELSDMEKLFRESDFITVHTPLTEQTKYIINRESFKLMKDGVRIINCARGGIIKEADLIEALNSGKVAGCALDVFEKEPPGDNPLLKHPKVVVTPHLGASTEEAQINVAIDIAETVRDALLGKGIRNAVNVPSVDAEVLKAVEPYLRLAEKIGSMQAQLAEGSINEVKVKYIGDITEYNTSAITLALAKGLLTPILQETVNYVNALLIARERGISIVEAKTREVMDFANAIVVTVETNKSANIIMGTLFTRVDPRIIRINDYHVDLIPEGYTLFLMNDDLPGVVGDIGNILGRNKINIAGMTFGRKKRGGDAITVLNIDSAPDEKVLGQLREAKNIKCVKLLKL